MFLSTQVLSGRQCVTKGNWDGMGRECRGETYYSIGLRHLDKRALRPVELLIGAQLMGRWVLLCALLVRFAIEVREF